MKKCGEAVRLLYNRVVRCPWYVFKREVYRVLRNEDKSLAAHIDWVYVRYTGKTWGEWEKKVKVKYGSIKESLK